MTKQELLRELLCDARLDPWGYTMSAWFNVAGELYRRDEWIPDSWEYRPGAGGGEVDEFYALALAEADVDTLREAGYFLQSLSDRLRRNGHDY